MTKTWRDYPSSSRENRRKIEKTYLDKHPEKRLQYSIRRSARRLGIDPAEAERFYAEHDGLCDICGEKQTVERIGRLCIDHDHKTGRVRGLLCDNCNNGLGRFKDDPSLLRNAADYLEMIVGVND